MIFDVFLHGSFEETLAALASPDTVVLASSKVPTDKTSLIRVHNIVRSCLSSQLSRASLLQGRIGFVGGINESMVLMMLQVVVMLVLLLDVGLLVEEMLRLHGALLVALEFSGF